MNNSWFHCGRCGRLFQALAGESEERVCTSCGSNPSLGIEPPAKTPAGHAPLPFVEPTGHAGHREKHHTRKHKRSYFMLKLVTGWMVFIALIVLGARKLWPEKPRKESFPAAVSAADMQREGDAELLNEASQRCMQLFTGFLAATSPEQRSQYVFSPITTSAHMAKFESMNQRVSISPQSLKFFGNAVVHLGGKRAIEFQWTDTDGRFLDAVFMEENGEWRLDWDHFARFSEIPWPLFLAGSGEESGEFRLLARERLPEERKDASDLSLILYAPRAGSAKETGFASPEILVPRDSKEGRMLEAAFQMAAAGKQPFDTRLKDINPEGLIRVRARIKRVTLDPGRRFEIEELSACHWYSSDEPGIVPQAAPARN